MAFNGIVKGKGVHGVEFFCWRIVPSEDVEGSALPASTADATNRTLLRSSSMHASVVYMVFRNSSLAKDNRHPGFAILTFPLRAISQGWNYRCFLAEMRTSGPLSFVALALLAVLSTVVFSRRLVITSLGSVVHHTR